MKKKKKRNTLPGKANTQPREPSREKVRTCGMGNQGQKGSTEESSGRRWLPLRETIEMPQVTSGLWGRALKERRR